MLLPTVTVVLFQSNVATKLITNSGNEETGENFKVHISKLVLKKKKIWELNFVMGCVPNPPTYTTHLLIEEYPSKTRSGNNLCKFRHKTRI